MSISNIIQNTLNLEDPNITFFDNCLSNELIHGVEALVYHGILSPSPPPSCPHCGCLNEDNSIIKHGSKYSLIKVPSVSNCVAYLRLKKQRYLCHHCHHTFSAKTSIVKEKHSISINTLHAATLDLKMKISIKDIAHRYNISHTTLNNHLHSISDDFIIRKDYLPEHLCFDEFKSVKTINAHMSFLFLDASTGHVLDVVSNRQLPFLKQYFHMFTLDARKMVKSICIDMYSPYIELIHSCFPNAIIINDRFHIIQLLNRSLNSTRNSLMKQSPKHRNKLRRYWKFFLMNREKLNSQDYKHYLCFPHKMTQIQVVDELLRIDDTLYETYWFYQHYLYAFKHKDYKECQSLITSSSLVISSQMKKTIRTLNKYEAYVKNALTHSQSNGVIEGTNNLIKVVKRIAFGYRSYENFRARILLITNTLVTLKTT